MIEAGYSRLSASPISEEETSTCDQHWAEQCRPGPTSFQKQGKTDEGLLVFSFAAYTCVIKAPCSLALRTCWTPFTDLSAMGPGLFQHDTHCCITGEREKLNIPSSPQPTTAGGDHGHGA